MQVNMQLVCKLLQRGRACRTTLPLTMQHATQLDTSKFFLGEARKLLGKQRCYASNVITWTNKETMLSADLVSLNGWENRRRPEQDCEVWCEMQIDILSSTVKSGEPKSKQSEQNPLSVKARGIESRDIPMFWYIQEWGAVIGSQRFKILISVELVTVSSVMR